MIYNTIGVRGLRRKIQYILVLVSRIQNRNSDEMKYVNICNEKKKCEMIKDCPQRGFSAAASNLDALKENPSNTEGRNKLITSKASLTWRLTTLDTQILSNIEQEEQIEAELFDARHEFKEVLENILLQIDGA